MNLKLTVLSVALMLCGIFSILGQTGSGCITVVDDKTGETLVGANVIIDGTTKGATSDLDGVATLALDPGTYDIRVSYISYQPTVVKDVKVDPGKINIFTVRLNSADLQINEVVITAKAARNTENALLTLQKQSPKLFDAITSDQFSKIGARDAAGALKKVTGVTISGGKYVYIRGLGDRYSKSMLNGSDVPSLDPNKNAVQLDLFPANLLDNIIVYKTFTPDLPGDFAGGLIDINTKDFPESFNWHLSVGFDYNKQSNFNSNFLTAKGSPTDFLGFDNGFRSLPALLKQYNAEDFPGPYGDKTTITEVSRAFKNRQFQPGKASQFLNHDFNFSIGNQFLLFKRQLGYIFGLSYSRDFSNYTRKTGVENVFEGISQGQTTLNNDILTTSKEQRSTDEVLLGAMFNTSYKINSNNKISIALLANQSGNSENRYQDGYKLDNASDSTVHLQNRTINYTERSFGNGQIRGEHVIKGLNNLNIAWSNSYTFSSIDQPDFRLMRNTYSFDENSGDTLYNVGNNDKPSRFYRDLKEINDNAKLDFTLPVALFYGLKSKIKFGGYFLYKNRSYRENVYQYSIQYNRSYDGDISGFFLDKNLGWVNNGTELRNFLLMYNNKSNNFDAYQWLQAGYAMIESAVTKKLKITAGVRFEKTLMHLKAFSDSSGIIQTNDLLPSVAFTYNLNEKTNLRISANRTLARPSFREFAPLATFDFFGGYIQNGNPDLKRTLINNYDLRWERFPNPGEYLSLSLFYKKFFNPIENTQLRHSSGSASEFQYNNVDQSYMYGIELEARKNLGSEGAFLQHFKAAANFSYVYAFVNVTNDELQTIQTWNPGASKTRPMFNQAPYTVNASILYENPDKGWESNLNFNVSGTRLLVYQIDLPSIYLQPMPDLNFTVMKTLFEHYSIRFRVKNILNNIYKEQMTLDNNAFYKTKYQLGRTFSLSLSYNFK
jgi:TonB-dependent receptor